MEPEKTLLALLDLTTAFFTSTADLLRKSLLKEHTEKPKKPRTKSGYQLFTDNCVQQLKAAHDTRSPYTAPKLADLVKQVSAKWKLLSPEERAKWKNQASSIKAVDPALLNLLEEEPVTERKKRGDWQVVRSPTPTETESEED